jgi:hypothetical protein
MMDLFLSVYGEVLATAMFSLTAIAFLKKTSVVAFCDSSKSRETF